MSHNLARFDDGAHFVTFSCYKRRRLLDTDQAKRIVIGLLGDQLRLQSARCIGFVIMPNHVHALLWFPEPDQSSSFLQQWKQRTSVNIKKFINEKLQNYARTFDLSEPVWQPRSYDFNVLTEKKILQKLEYMHNNPVKAGLAKDPCDWAFSSARFYLLGKSVGLKVGMV